MPTRSVQLTGLRYVPDYVTLEEQSHLLEIIDSQPWLAETKRRMQRYGHCCPHARGSPSQTGCIEPLPWWAVDLGVRLTHDGWMPRAPEQLSVNEYVAGQGIGSHVDCVRCYGPTIVGISLGSPCIMRFTASGVQERIEMQLEAQALLVMREQARYAWAHGIPARRSDAVAGRNIARARRVSLTFRNLARHAS